MPSLRKLRNRERSKTAYIIANGPSVLHAPLDTIHRGVVIGSNATTLLHEQRGLRQDYYVVSDRRFITHPEKRRLACESLSPHTVRVVRSDLQPDDDASLVNRTYYARAIGRDGVSSHLETGFYHGCSVAMLGVQLALWLGCREINLVGVDLTYSPDQMRFYKEEKPQEEDVFTSVQVRNFAEAGRVCAQMGIKMHICSEKSLLRPYLPFLCLRAESER